MNWRDGVQIAEASAWAEHGKRHSTFYIWRRFIVPTAGLVVLGVAGYAAYRGWVWLTAGEGGGVPMAMWVVPAVLAIVTAVAAKGTGRVRPLSTLAVLSIVIGAAWLFWLGALISMLT